VSGAPLIYFYRCYYYFLSVLLLSFHNVLSRGTVQSKPRCPVWNVVNSKNFIAKLDLLSRITLFLPDRFLDFDHPGWRGAAVLE